MEANYNSWLVALSIVVAMVVAYTALKLAARVAEAGRSGGRLWLLGGAAAMGMGIWSMHFVGMLAYSVAIPLRYSVFKTLLSLAIAMVTSGFALAIASRSRLSLARLAVGSVVMGAGICAMHYSGMSAIQIVPIITYQPMLVLASIAIAVGASFAALWLAFNLRNGQSTYIALARGGAAVVMGLAISGMHYTAMAASKLAVGAYCFGGAAFDNNWLAVTIGLVALGVLALTLITAVYDAHLVSQTRQDAVRLEQVNAALQHGKNLLALATRAAGISSWELDIATRKTLWTENEIESLRIAGVDTRAQPDALMTLTHSADRSIMFDAISDAMAKNEEVCAFRFRVMTPAGNAIHLEAHARIFCDAAGKPERILGVSWDVTNQVLQEERKRDLQSQLRDASRDAGMAEVATGVLHSVGNVLNSLGVSASLMQTQLRDSRVGNVQRIASLLSEQGSDLAGFLENDPRGRQLPTYLVQLGENLLGENQRLQAEAAAIAAHVGHIRNIVAAQQTYARRGGVTEAIDIAEILDSAVAIHFADMTDVTVKREYEPMTPLTLDRHKLIQILGNLLSNARHALKDLAEGRRLLTLRVRQQNADSAVIEVQDSGVGIAPEVLQRLFEFGFTTKRDGHGFGLHTSAILAKELAGELSASSDGAGRGARFVLRLPSVAAEMKRQA
ncbi:MAG TPA: MHYT domain-containing protein [Steroidobacteraceae bacterium]|jgi:NO-binding membrane sensor protein with MHYT domain/two-component sensor histidine kinase|nr:MHYT domain-containing protein [Steroidobacteraceae bacterium]